MRPLGLRFRWRMLDLTKVNEPVCSLLILTLEGNCELEGPCKPDARPVRSGWTHALGWTHVTDGEILPFCSVDCDRVRRTVAAVLQRRPLADRERLFARALGRVAAHELYHILAGTRSHSQEGLAQPFVRAEDLVLFDTGFDETAVAAMRRALRELSCQETDTRRIGP